MSEPMDAKSLKRLLPRNKDDVEAATALVALGYPAVGPVLPQMLDWLKLIGSPVGSVMRDFFVDLGMHADPAWLREWARFKAKRLRELLSQAEHIESLLAP